MTERCECDYAEKRTRPGEKRPVVFYVCRLNPTRQADRKAGLGCSAAEKNKCAQLFAADFGYPSSGDEDLEQHPGDREEPGHVGSDISDIYDETRWD